MSELSRLGDKRSRRIQKHKNRSRISVIDVFRSSFEERDATVGPEFVDDGKAKVAKVSHRGQARRQGVDTTTLREQVQKHLADLMHTINLGSAIDLSDTPAVGASVLNYGLNDFSDTAFNDVTRSDIATRLKKSLIDHEPRLLPSSVAVEISAEIVDFHSRINVHVKADVQSDPADLPVEFIADVDLGSGMVTLGDKEP